MSSRSATAERSNPRSVIDSAIVRATVPRWSLSRAAPPRRGAARPSPVGRRQPVAARAPAVTSRWVLTNWLIGPVAFQDRVDSEPVPERLAICSVTQNVAAEGLASGESITDLLESVPIGSWASQQSVGLAHQVRSLEPGHLLEGAVRVEDALLTVGDQGGGGQRFQSLPTCPFSLVRPFGFSRHAGLSIPSPTRRPAASAPAETPAKPSALHPAVEADGWERHPTISPLQSVRRVRPPARPRRARAQSAVASARNGGRVCTA